MGNIKDKVELSFSNGGELSLHTDELFELEDILNKYELYKEALDKVGILMDNKGWDKDILDVFNDLENSLSNL